MKEIENWLDSSVKNEYYYKSYPGLVTDITGYKLEWFDTIAKLRNSMKDNWTKEEYLNWVKTWKMIYSKLTIESRWSKLYRSSNRVKVGTEINTELALRISYANLEQVWSLRNLANILLDIREESKVLAEKAYRASHPEKVLEAV